MLINSLFKNANNFLEYYFGQVDLQFMIFFILFKSLWKGGESKPELALEHFLLGPKDILHQTLKKAVIIRFSN